MHGLGLLRRRGLPRSDGPHGLVCDDQVIRVADDNILQSPRKLTADDLFLAPGLALVERLADAQDRAQLIAERRLDLPMDQLVAFLKVLAPLGVTDDHVATPNGAEHRCGDLSGECPRFLVVDILRTQIDGGISDDLRHGVQAYERWT